MADILLRSFSLALGLPEEYMYKLCDKGAHISKVNYYSVVLQFIIIILFIYLIIIMKVRKPLDDEPRVLQHTDATIFTVSPLSFFFLYYCCYYYSLIMKILTHLDPHSRSLQARKRKTVEWVYADPIPDGTFINVGDFLERWTNKRVYILIAYIVSFNLLLLLVCVNSTPSGLAKRGRGIIL